MIAEIEAARHRTLAHIGSPQPTAHIGIDGPTGVGPHYLERHYAAELAAHANAVFHVMLKPGLCAAAIEHLRESKARIVVYAWGSADAAGEVHHFDYENEARDAWRAAWKTVIEYWPQLQSLRTTLDVDRLQRRCALLPLAARDVDDLLRAAGATHVILRGDLHARIMALIEDDASPRKRQRDDESSDDKPLRRPDARRAIRRLRDESDDESERPARRIAAADDDDTVSDSAERRLRRPYADESDSLEVVSRRIEYVVAASVKPVPAGSCIAREYCEVDNTTVENFRAMISLPQEEWPTQRFFTHIEALRAMFVTMGVASRHKALGEIFLLAAMNRVSLRKGAGRTECFLCGKGHSVVETLVVSVDWTDLASRARFVEVPRLLKLQAGLGSTCSNRLAACIEPFYELNGARTEYAATKPKEWFFERCVFTLSAIGRAQEACGICD